MINQGRPDRASRSLADGPCGLPLCPGVGLGAARPRGPAAGAPVSSRGPDAGATAPRPPVLSVSFIFYRRLLIEEFFLVHCKKKIFSRISDLMTGHLKNQEKDFKMPLSLTIY